MAIFALFAEDAVPRRYSLLIAGVLAVWSFAKFDIASMIKGGIALSFLPHDPSFFGYAALLWFAVLFLLIRGRIVWRPIHTVSAFLGLSCTLSYVFSQYLIEVNVLSFPFFLMTSATPMVFLYLASSQPVRRETRWDILSFFLMCATLQAALIVVSHHGALVRILSDYLNGTFIGHGTDSALGSTNYQQSVSFAMLLALGIDISLRWARVTGRPPRGPAPSNWRLVLLTTAVVIAEAKAVVGSFAIAAATAGLLLPSARLLLRRRFSALRDSVLALAAIVLILSAVHFWSSQLGNDYFNQYAKRPDRNHKFVFLQRAIGEIHQSYGTWVFGTGPGTVGSRAANARAYDTLYKRERRIPGWIPPFTSTPARTHLVDLYQEEFAASVQNQSSVLSIPFSSAVSAFVELGSLGLLFGAALFLAIAGQAGKLAVVKRGEQASVGLVCFVLVGTVLCMMCFDTVLERPLFMAPFWTFSGLIAGWTDHGPTFSG